MAPSIHPASIHAWEPFRGKREGVLKTHPPWPPQLKQSLQELCLLWTPSAFLNVERSCALSFFQIVEKIFNWIQFTLIVTLPCRGEGAMGLDGPLTPIGRNIRVLERGENKHGIGKGEILFERIWKTKDWGGDRYRGLYCPPPLSFFFVVVVDWVIIVAHYYHYYCSCCCWGQLFSFVSSPRVHEFFTSSVLVWICMALPIVELQFLCCIGIWTKSGTTTTTKSTTLAWLVFFLGYWFHKTAVK